MKYIVKNCPAITKGNMRCRFGYAIDNNNYCSKVPDCLFKLIIKKCKEEIDPTLDQWTREKENLAKEILKMFEIEEVE